MNRKSIYYLLAAFAGITLIIVLSVANARNSKNLKAEKLISRTTQAEKSNLEKELAKSKADYFSMKQVNDANAGHVKEISARLVETEARISTLTRENRSLAADRKELSQLKNLSKDLENQISNLNSDREQTLQESRELQARLTRLEKEKNDLISQLERSSIFRSDNFLATATRGKATERLVVRASRAKKLNLTFEVPGNLSENLSFRITTPEGKVIAQEDSNLSWHYAAGERNITASLSPFTGEFANSRSVVLTYNVKDKLSRGEYKIQILTDGNSIGICRLMVR